MEDYDGFDPQRQRTALKHALARSIYYITGTHREGASCFDSQGNGQTDPVIFTNQTHINQQKIGTLGAYESVQNFSASPVFYNPYPEMLYNFPISSNFLNNRYIDLTITLQFTAGDFIELVNDQEYFDMFHISFIVYDLDEQELLLTSTQDVDFKKIGETLPRKINNVR